MKKNVIFGLLAGAAAGAAAVFAGKRAVDKISTEIRGDMSEQTFTSPDGRNSVTVAHGSSATAGGLTMLSITASAQNKEDVCHLRSFAKKSARLIGGWWQDNDRFTLLIGSKRRRCCEVDFTGEETVIRYSLRK